MVGTHVTRRFARGPHAFERAQDVFRFAGLASLLSTTVSATVAWPASLSVASRQIYPSESLMAR